MVSTGGGLSFGLMTGGPDADVAYLESLPLESLWVGGHVASKNPSPEAMVALTLGPLMLPALVTGVGLLQLFQYAGLREHIGFTALLVGHVVICLPFAVRTVGISLQTLPPNPGRKAGFKDCLIEVLRDEFDDVAWQAALDRAHTLHDQRAGA